MKSLFFAFVLFLGLNQVHAAQNCATDSGCIRNVKYGISTLRASYYVNSDGSKTLRNIKFRHGGSGYYIGIETSEEGKLKACKLFGYSEFLDFETRLYGQSKAVCDPGDLYYNACRWERVHATVVKLGDRGEFIEVTTTAFHYNSNPDFRSLESITCR